MYPYGGQPTQQGGYYGQPQQQPLQYQNQAYNPQAQQHQQQQQQQQPAHGNQPHGGQPWQPGQPIPAQQQSTAGQPSSRDIVNGDYVSVYPGQPAYQVRPGAQPQQQQQQQQPQASGGYGAQWAQPPPTSGAPPQNNTAAAPQPQQQPQQQYTGYGAQYAQQHPHIQVQGGLPMFVAAQNAAHNTSGNTTPNNANNAYNAYNSSQYSGPPPPPPAQRKDSNYTTVSHPAAIPVVAAAQSNATGQSSFASSGVFGYKNGADKVDSIWSPQPPQPPQPQSPVQQVHNTNTGISSYEPQQQHSTPAGTHPPQNNQLPSASSNAAPWLWDRPDAEPAPSSGQPNGTAGIYEPASQEWYGAGAEANSAHNMPAPNAQMHQPWYPGNTPSALNQTSQPAPVDPSPSQPAPGQSTSQPWYQGQDNNAQYAMPPANSVQNQPWDPQSQQSLAPPVTWAPNQPAQTAPVATQHPAQGGAPPVSLSWIQAPDPNSQYAMPPATSVQNQPWYPQNQNSAPAPAATSAPAQQAQAALVDPYAMPPANFQQPPQPQQPQWQQPGQAPAPPQDPVAAAQQHLANLSLNQNGPRQHQTPPVQQHPPVTTQPPGQPMYAPGPSHQPLPGAIALPNVPPQASQPPAQPATVAPISHHPPPPNANLMSPQIVSQGVLSNATASPSGFPPGAAGTPTSYQASPATASPGVAQAHPGGTVPQSAPPSAAWSPPPATPAPQVHPSIFANGMPQQAPSQSAPPQPVQQQPPGTTTILPVVAVAGEEIKPMELVPVTEQELQRRSPVDQSLDLPSPSASGPLCVLRKKKALIIGINYVARPELRLGGCINDARMMALFLVKVYGYDPSCILLLTDDQEEEEEEEEDRLPTTEAIWEGMHWLVAGAQPGDSFVFHFSGHGTRVADYDGDEDDGLDECIVPLDWEAGRDETLITDDEMHDVMVKPLPVGCKLTAIFDSCHSGSALDLPYSYSTQGTLKEPSKTKEMGQGLIKAVGHMGRKQWLGAGKEVFDTVRKVGKQDKMYMRQVVNKTHQADVVSWSSSKDDQVSMEAPNMPFGLMSACFIKALAEDPRQSYIMLLNNLRALMVNFHQKPQLSCSHPLDTRLLFAM
ncbi:hypothetical protein MKZ38_009071 [Zalerion maritima]|uniref:Peptidase C14 caspase domain-containing protein n=1 Tax=Zalerion maritima TaxID=339359 RepID=A0AAD5RGN0_9PEZI|nr:hypothetical protein MKZ38_009071 [Zalerion maritima]